MNPCKTVLIEIISKTGLSNFSSTAVHVDHRSRIGERYFVCAEFVEEEHCIKACHFTITWNITQHLDRKTQMSTARKVNTAQCATKKNRGPSLASSSVRD